MKVCKLVIPKRLQRDDMRSSRNETRWMCSHCGYERADDYGSIGAVEFSHGGRGVGKTGEVRSLEVEEMENKLYVSALKPASKRRSSSWRPSGTESEARRRLH